jgi:8-oxo-dGTP pyrophosphatase MutT (NUDIX family)
MVFAASDADSPNRERLINELSAYRPSDARETAMVAQLLRFVMEQERCFERGLTQGHVTGSAWVVDRARTRALLTHHRKLGKWLQLGGHADGESDIRAVAFREATEESGLRHIVPASKRIYDVDVHEIPERGDEPAHLHYDVRFAFYADPDEELHPSDESHALAWVALLELEKLGVDESVLRLASKTKSLA